MANITQEGKAYNGTGKDAREDAQRSAHKQMLAEQPHRWQFQTEEAYQIARSNWKKRWHGEHYGMGAATMRELIGQPVAGNTDVIHPRVERLREAYLKLTADLFCGKN